MLRENAINDICEKNDHFAFHIIFFLLLIGNLHPNPGPYMSTLPNTPSGPLNIVHVNAYSLLPKLDLTEVKLCEYNIIIISETHLNDDIKTKDILLKGFQKLVEIDLEGV